MYRQESLDYLGRLGVVLVESKGQCTLMIVLLVSELEAILGYK
jgi:hypothetical protein